MMTLGIFLTGVGGGLVVPFVAFDGKFATPAFLGFVLSSCCFSILGLLVSLDIIHRKRPVDFRGGAAWGWGWGEKSLIREVDQVTFSSSDRS